MKRLVFLITMAAILAGCVSPGEARREGEDDRACVSYGFVKGTEGYSQCRLQLAHNRALARSGSSSSQAGAIAGENVRRAMSEAYKPPARANCISRQSYPGAAVYTNCF